MTNLERLSMGVVPSMNKIDHDWRFESEYSVVDLVFDTLCGNCPVPSELQYLDLYIISHELDEVCALFSKYYETLEHLHLALFPSQPEHLGRPVSTLGNASWTSRKSSRIRP
jgi:hypothetical protein